MDWCRQVEVIQFQNHILALNSADNLSTVSKGAHYINNDGQLHKNSMSPQAFIFSVRILHIVMGCGCQGLVN